MKKNFILLLILMFVFMLATPVFGSENVQPKDIRLNESPVGFKDIAQEDILKARALGENIYSQYYNDVIALPKPIRDEVAKELSEL
jgi:hypothetical protein